MRALALLVLSLALPPAAPAAESPWVGVNDISSVGGRVPFPAAARAAARLGSTSTRVVVDWSWLESRRGTYTWGVLDGVYHADLANGLRPLIGITGAPRWAWPRGARCPAAHCAHPPGNRFRGAYARLLRAVARRYPRAVAIQIGNEPNLEWAWAGGVSPARYTRLLKAGYRAVKSVAPGMPVLAAGLAPVLDDSRSPQKMGLRPFLTAMYAHGAREAMDGIAVHPYPHATDFDESFTALSIVKDVRDAHGDDAPIWATEVGMSTSEFSAQDQGATLPALVSALRQDPEIRGVYVHTLFDDPENPVAVERGFGLLDGNGDPKPAFCGVAAALGGSGVCPPAPVDAAQQARWDAQVALQAAADAARRVRLKRGTYAGLGAADLHAEDPRLSARPAPGTLLPGLSADPDQIGVYPLGADDLVLCNRSRGGRSYCYGTRFARRWAWESTAGTVFATAGSLLKP